MRNQPRVRGEFYNAVKTPQVSHPSSTDLLTMTHRQLFVCLALGLAAGCCVQPQARAQQPLRNAEKLIQPADIKADVAFLASDDLGGRDAGSLQDHIAAEYIAAEFRRLGLQPMGDNGTYLQHMTL